MRFPVLFFFRFALWAGDLLASVSISTRRDILQVPIFRFRNVSKVKIQQPIPDLPNLIFYWCILFGLILSTLKFWANCVIIYVFGIYKLHHETLLTWLEKYRKSLNWELRVIDFFWSLVISNLSRQRGLNSLVLFGQGHQSTRFFAWLTT